MTYPLAVVAALLLQQPAVASPVTPYWQQRVGYEISARLDEPTGVLAGTERIRYTNRSPDTLRTFSLHLHLNAFRPGSRWADRDSTEGRRRFNDLADPAFAFNHVRNVRIMGAPATAVYPLAPDSTIVRFDLPRALAPGDSMLVELDWDARPSVVPRRQGRAGRRFDFAQWYPKVVVYDRHGWNEQPLTPAGEFYGEFATYRVTLDVPADQVVGATGVALCGDPGWERANQAPGSAIEYQRDWYGARGGAADCTTGVAEGRKRLVWYAEDVHHFAMSLNPEYRYEGGRYDGVAIHVLYQPGDEASWGGGVAVKRTETALAWLDQLFGKFTWPQMTNVHRIEGGGTEFPMMVHNGSASQGLIVHEVGHNYVMGILANNEWREGWLDEGFTSFQSTWFAESVGQRGGYEGTERFILGLDLDGMSEPTSLASDAYRDFATYNTMIYARGELFFHQLRYIVGNETMRRILRTFYDRWKLKHVDEAAFRAVAEEVSGRDLSTFFGQWLHGTALYDYAVGRVERRRTPDGKWRTRVEVLRKADGRIPVDVAVVAGTDTAVVRAEGLAEREWVEIETADQPRRVLLDPRVRTHDWNMLNNRRTVGFSLSRILAADQPTEHYVDNYFTTRVRRDRRTVGWAPTAWYNDVGGVTLGLRSRTNYLGRFEVSDLYVSHGTGLANDAGIADHEDLDFSLRLQNPTYFRAAGLSPSLEAFRVEGRLGGRLAVTKTSTPHLGFGPTWTRGASLQWVGTENEAYLDPAAYDNAGTLEVALTNGVVTRSGGWGLEFDASVAGGVAYANPGPAVVGGERYDLGGYARGTIEATARRAIGSRLGLAVRLFAGTIQSDGPEVRQRQIFLAGADPYEQLRNPFTRSRGSLFRQEDVHYHQPGGANLRGFHPYAAAPNAAALNVEIDRALLLRPRAGLFRRASIALFGDVAVADGDFARAGSTKARMSGDAGIGLRATHRIGTTEFTTRIDLPLWVSIPELAADGDADESFGFRWLFSFQPAL